MNHSIKANRVQHPFTAITVFLSREKQFTCIEYGHLSNASRISLHYLILGNFQRNTILLPCVERYCCETNIFQKDDG